MFQKHEKVNNLIIQADQAVQNENFEEAMEIFQQALNIAEGISWEERVGQINLMISEMEEVKKKKIIKMKADEKKEELKSQKQEKIKKLEIIAENNKKIQNRNAKERNALLKQKKERESNISNKGYQLLELASNAVQNNEYVRSIEKFKEALDLFKSIEWNAEVIRIQEFLDDVYRKQKIWDKKQQLQQKRNEIQTEFELNHQKFQENSKKHLDLLETREKEKSHINSLEKKTKDDAFNKILSDLEAIEDEVKKYEYNLKNSGIFSIPESIYPKVIDFYLKKSVELKNLGFFSQSNQIKEGALAYKEKYQKDKKLRFIEMKKKEKEELLQKDLENKIQNSNKKIEIIKEKQNIRKMEKKLEEEEKQKEATHILNEISQIDRNIRTYERNPKRFHLQSPYLDAINIYKSSLQKLVDLGWQMEARILQDGIKNYSEKNIKDQEQRLAIQKKTKQIEQETKEIEEKAQKSQEEYEKYKKRLEKTKQQEKSEEVQNSLTAEKILDEIEKMEKNVTEYEKNPNRLNENCPYSEAIELYRNSIPKLVKLGWKSQAALFKDAIIRYTEKLVQDKRKRLIQQKKLEQEKIFSQKLEESSKKSIESKTRKTQQINAVKLKEIEKKRKKERESNSIFTEIDSIELKIKEYERNPKRYSTSCPYPEIIDNLKTNIPKLIDLGWVDQCIRLKEALSRYIEKNQKDQNTRMIQKQINIHDQYETQKIEKVAEKSKEYVEGIQEELQRIQKKEQDALRLKNEEAKAILDQISENEKKIKDYEHNPQKFDLESPYENIINIIREKIPRLNEIGWNDQAKRFEDAILRYNEKMDVDKKLRKIEIQKKEKEASLANEIEILSKKAKLQIKREQDELDAARYRELQKMKEKEEIAQKVYQKIENLEKKVKSYENNPDRLSIKSPYEEAIKLYHESADTLEKIEWVEQSNILRDSIEIYQDKLQKDEKIRFLSEKKEIRRKADELKIQYQIELSKKIQESKLKIKEDAQKREVEKESRNYEIAQKILNDIEEMESKIVIYEQSPDKIFLTCPYQEAISINRKSIVKLNEIGWKEQSQHLKESIKVYNNKIIEDKEYREEFKRNQEDLAKQAKEFELQAKKAKLEYDKLKKQQEIKTQEKINQEKRTNTFVKEIYEKIDEIELEVKEYENNVNKLNLIAPYLKALDVYQDSLKNLREIGWNEQAQRIEETIQLYKEKYHNDELERRNFKIKQFKQKKQQEILERRLDLAKQMDNEEKIKREKQEEREIQRIQQEDDLSQKAFALLDEGNNLARFHKYEDAVQRFRDASDVFKSIHWEKESEKVDMQIVLFKEEQENYENQLIQQAEMKFKEKRYFEEIERKALISEQILSKQKNIDEKRRYHELLIQKQNEEEEVQRIIEQSQIEELNTIKSQKFALKNQLEKEEHENTIFLKCNELLDIASKHLEEHRFSAALNIYNDVKILYTEINYMPGVKIANETILKVQNEQNKYNYQLEREVLLKEKRELEKVELEKLIQLAKEQEDQKNLILHRKELNERELNAKNDEIQRKIIKSLQTAGELRVHNSFSEAIEKYKEALMLLQQINWPLKEGQIKDLIKITYEEERKFKEKQENLKLLAEEKIREQEKFKTTLQQQENFRNIHQRQTSSKENSISLSSTSQEIPSEESNKVISSTASIENQNYELLELAEECISGRKTYLSLYYFHYAFLNFRKLGWNRELEITKNRLMQVYHGITDPLLDLNDLLTSSSLSEELEICTALTDVVRYHRYFDFSKVYEKIEFVKIYLSLLKWKASLQKINEFEKKIQNLEKEQYILEEKRKQEPTYEKAIELISRAESYFKNQQFEKCFKLSEVAINMFLFLNLSKKSQDFTKQLIVWKLEAERKTKKEFLNPDDRKIARIEKRKRERRAKLQNEKII